MNKTKRNLDEKIKKYESSMKSIQDYFFHEYINEDNKIQIDINIYKGFDIFEPLSMGKQKDLNKEIYDFIDEKIHMIPHKYEICICFYNSNLTKKEEKEIKSIIEEHYYLILREKRINLRINTIKILSLTVIGVLLLSLYFILEIHSNKPVFMEFLSIAGSFALWEAVDFYLLERRGLEIERLDVGQVALSQIILK
ncbi:hypothetical protein [Terrisporobacter mayombei]|uniref:DUF2812 domain-containing protein n=1 Tax=Terrisporobacter mayombei TaxID=1541 RepID=A0ABY9PXK1_9FIRM|nr:hypothetical protein [Terrisporobacter mayombei]MCC3868282.1 hypothetical protein [Terrisporobacter mayombei]WMT80423.1 hypothetical protein TEMA_07400 [Terrisporobacter mayombei]